MYIASPVVLNFWFDLCQYDIPLLDVVMCKLWLFMRSKKDSYRFNLLEGRTQQGILMMLAERTNPCLMLVKSK